MARLNKLLALVFFFLVGYLFQPGAITVAIGTLFAVVIALVAIRLFGFLGDKLS